MHEWYLTNVFNLLSNIDKINVQNNIILPNSFLIFLRFVWFKKKKNYK